MSEKISLCVLFGGVSTEHDVSLQTAFSVLSNLNALRYDIYPVGITSDGRWYLYSGAYDAIPDKSWEKDPRNLTAYISPERGGYLCVHRPEGIEKIKLDCVFPALHGANGEDGSIQGLTQLAGLPCVGSGLTASACAMDKTITNTIADTLGVAQAKWDWFYIYEYKKNPSAYLDRIEAGFGYPVFVKPSSSGSSVGISKAKNRDEMDKAIITAGKYCRKVIIEEYIDGRELEVSILGNTELFVTPAAEIIPDEEFYSYASKYLNGKSEINLAAELGAEEMEKIRSCAALIFSKLGCAGLSRVDFFLRKSDNAVLFNEINTIPGFTSISVYSKLIEKAGISYPSLLDRLIDLSIEDAKGGVNIG